MPKGLRSPNALVKYSSSHACYINEKRHNRGRESAKEKMGTQFITREVDGEEDDELFVQS